MTMINSLFLKGTFQPINNQFIMESKEALDDLSRVQEKYDKKDIDNFLNELHDSIVGFYLGFKLINVEKHGFDCKHSVNKDVFLESKVASFGASSWTATFNDTTMEKANAFKSKNLWLALSVWKNTSDLLFICYGQNPRIGDFLEEKVRSFKAGNGVRSTQTISMVKLVVDYGFRILSISQSPQQLYSLLSLSSREMKNHLTLDMIDTPKTMQSVV